MAFIPGQATAISYTIDFPAPIGQQKTCIDLAAETYGSEIAPARTFGYKADESKLRDMGLIRGASPENAIILGANGPENGPLRFPDEYVRHKVLDLIGDLALAGRRLEGHVVAVRAGHAMHTALVARLLKDRSAWELAHVPVEAPASREPKLEARSGMGEAHWRGRRRCVSSAHKFKTQIDLEFLRRSVRSRWPWLLRRRCRARRRRGVRSYFLSAASSVTRMRAPDAPMGWPSAQAPPWTLTFS